MATPRSITEIKQIANHCLEIERAGGDVLAYLRTEHYISPRGTWFNMQREILHRSRSQITDGRPERKEDDDMAKNHKLTLQQKNHAVELAIAGKNPIPYLVECGAKNPYASWDYITKVLQKNDPDRYAKIPPMIIGKVVKKEATDDGIKVEVDTSPVRAEDVLKAVGIEPDDEKPDDTGYQLGGFTAVETMPVKLCYRILQLSTDTGVYTKEPEDKMSFRTGNKSITLTVEQWKQMLSEAPVIMHDMGLM